MIKWLLLFMLLAVLTIGQALYELDVEDNDFRDIKNYSNQIVWNYTPSTSSVDEAAGLTGIVNKFVDFAGFVGFEVAKMGIVYGYENPQYDFNFFMKVVIWIVVLSLIMVVIGSIVPLLAVTYLIYYYMDIGFKKLFKKR